MKLEAPFSKNEIKEAVFGMDGARSLRPDRFSLLFFQTGWDTIKDDLMMIFLDFFERGVMNKSMKSIFIILISKKKVLRSWGLFGPSA